MRNRYSVVSCCVLLSLVVVLDDAYAKKPQKSAEVSAIYLDVLRVKACAVGQGCSTVGGPKQINLLEMAEGKTDFAKQVLMPAKTNELRLILGKNSTIAVDGQTYPLTVPSGQVSGLKLKGQKVFGKTSGFLADITLDFDLAKGVVVKAKTVKGKGKKDKDTVVYSYSLKPIVRVSSAEVTPMPENMAAVLVKPNKDSSLTLGDNFSIFIPAGAVSEPVFIFAEETKSSMISSIVTLGPEGTIFSAPVQVKLKYYPEAIPGDYPEHDLVVLHDFREVSTQVDTVSKELTGNINHFSSVRGGVKEKVPVKIGQITYERRNDPPVHIVSFDKNANNYEIRLLSDMNQDRTINLKKNSDIAKDNNALVSINGFYWNGDLGTTAGIGKLSTTTIMNNILTSKYSGSEVLFGFGRNQDGLLLKRMTTNRTTGEKPEFEDEFKDEFRESFNNAGVGYENSKPTTNNVMRYLFGSTTTLMRDGSCKDQESEENWWSAIGYGNEKVAIISSEPSGMSTYVIDRKFCDLFSKIGVTDAVRLDGGPSVSLYFDNKHINPITSWAAHAKGYGTERYIAYAIGLIESEYIPPDNGGDDNDDNNGDDGNDESCPNGNGLYCGDGQLDRDKNTLYYCKDGEYKEQEKCSNGCQIMPAGTNDKCMSEPTSCLYGNGYYCGDSSLGQDEDTLYYCEDGQYDVHEQCSNGCQLMDPYVNDVCK